MTISEQENEVLQRTVDRINAMFQQVAEENRAPRVALWHTSPNGHVYGYTTEKVEGYYAALDYKPVGKGARTDPENWRMVKMSKRRKRKDAKALAYRWYCKARGG